MQMANLSVPFTKDSQLHKDSTPPQQPLSGTLHGHPRIKLQDTAQLRSFLYQELWATDLERMAPHLWMMSTQSSSNISALHRQKVKGREIVVTEDPRLHLVWIYDRVFVKPLPRYLLSHLFWSQFLSTEQSILRGRTQKEQQIYARIRTSVLGLLRTYYYLIQHESDFQIACKDDAQLLPSDISWEDFCRFSQNFLDIGDNAVSERYHYGELRLTRLNFHAKFLLRKFQYERVRGQYGVYFARFYGPLLFVFGIFSLILSAMQVELAVETLLTSSQWQKFWHACRWFVIVTLLSMAAIALVLPSLLIGMLIDELIFALKGRYGKRRSARRQSSNP